MKPNHKLLKQIFNRKTLSAPGSRKKALKKFLSHNLVYILSFILPVFVMLGIYIARSIYPFGDNVYLVRDMYHQYAPFFNEFSEKLRNAESLTYSWNIGMGVNFTALYAYYLASPFNWLLILFSRRSIIEIMNVFIVLKIGLSGWSFSYYICKHFRKKDVSVAIFALFYALSSYLAAYSWNIMWLDCLVLLPLVTLGLERLVKGDTTAAGRSPRLKSRLLYCISLSLAIISNYYIGFMICIFSVLYFIFLLFTEDYRKDIKIYFVKAADFAIYSLFAGGLAAFLLLPEFYALKMSGSGNMNFPDSLERYFSVLEMLSRSLMNVPVSTGLTHEPNIYSTVAIFLLIPLYWFSHSSCKKEKLGKVFLIFVFLFSFNLNIPDFIWHGFHFPNSLPARQSFIYIFLLLTMCYEAFRNIKYYTDKQLYGSFAFAVAAFLLFDHLIVDEEYGFDIIYVSMIFVALYLLIFTLLRRKYVKPIYAKLPLLLLFLLTITETAVNTEVTGVETVSRSAYLSDNNDIDALLSQTKDDEDAFFRIEKYGRRTKNDGSWNQYKGASIFSSTTSAPLNDYLEDLGFQSSMNAFSFSGNTPLTSALLSVKYMISNGFMEDTDLTKLYAQADTFYLYKNNYTLPLGFMLDPAFEEKWDTSYNNSFLVQNSFVNALRETSGSDSIIEEDSNLTSNNGESSGSDLLTSVDVDTSGKTATVHVETSDTIYMNISNQDVTSIQVSVSTSDGTVISTSNMDDLKYKYMINLGSWEPGSTITVTVKEDVSGVSTSAYSFNDELFKSVYNELSKQPFVVDTFKDTYIKGTVNAAKDGLLYTSIPYEGGWSAVVDGKKTDITAFKDALVSVPLTKGQHTIEFTYSPQGFKPGIVISLGSLLILILIIVYEIKFPRKITKIEWDQKDMKYFGE